MELTPQLSVKTQILLESQSMLLSETKLPLKPVSVLLGRMQIKLLWEALKLSCSWLSKAAVVYLLRGAGLLIARGREMKQKQPSFQGFHHVIQTQIH